MDVDYKIKANKIFITKLMKPWYIDDEEDIEYFSNLWIKLKHITNLVKGEITCNFKTTTLKYKGNKDTLLLYSKANLRAHYDDECTSMVLYDDADRILISDITNEKIEVIKFFDLFDYIDSESKEDILDVKAIDIGCMNNGMYFKMNNELYKLYVNSMD